MAQEQLTILFDMTGLVAGIWGNPGYPKFVSDIFNPLRAANKAKFGIWTRDNLDLYMMDLSEYCQLFIGRREINEIGKAITEKNKTKLDLTWNKIDLSEGYPGLKETSERWKMWLENRGISQDTNGTWRTHWKYPPLLGNNKCLLVDSDLGGYQPGLGKIIRRGAERRLGPARKLGFSLILVPEYPQVWEGGNCSITPAAVLEALKARLLDWQGEKTVQDLGVELGIYHEIID